MIASHYVIADIIQTLEGGNISETEKIFRKFEKRYHKDKRLSCVFNEFEKHLIKPSEETLSDIMNKLKTLRATRKFESSAASALPLKDRRHFESLSCHEIDEFKR